MERIDAKTDAIIKARNAKMDETTDAILKVMDARNDAIIKAMNTKMDETTDAILKAMDAKMDVMEAGTGMHPK